MGEMVLVLPLLFVILALLVFFGRGIVRVQHAQVMDRYEAWRQATGAPGPAHGGTPSNEQMNQLFFGSNASSIEYAGSGYFPSQATDQFLHAASEWDRPPLPWSPPYDAGEFLQTVEGMFRQADDGRTVAFKTRHTNRVPLWERFNGPIHHGHVRIGNDWAHVNGWSVTTDSGVGSLELRQWNRVGPFGPNILGPIRDIHYPDLDADVASLGNPLAQAIRGIYLSQPGYGGPNVEE